MKHTPGPWLHPQGLALSRRKAGKPIDYEIPVTAGDRPIAFVSHYCAEESATARITERNRMEMQEANARLIAAAPPNAFEDISYGYHAHAYALNWRVERAASGSTSHYTGDTSVAELQNGVSRYYLSGSQNAIWLFSTRSAALRAARNQIERHVVEALAKLDAEIAAAEAKEQA